MYISASSLTFLQLFTEEGIMQLEHEICLKICRPTVLAFTRKLEIEGMLKINYQMKIRDFSFQVVIVSFKKKKICSP